MRDPNLCLTGILPQGSQELTFWLSQIGLYEEEEGLLIDLLWVLEIDSDLAVVAEAAAPL